MYTSRSLWATEGSKYVSMKFTLSARYHHNLNSIGDYFIWIMHDDTKTMAGFIVRITRTTKLRGSIVTRVTIEACWFVVLSYAYVVTLTNVHKYSWICKRLQMIKRSWCDFWLSWNGVSCSFTAVCTVTPGIQTNCKQMTSQCNGSSLLDLKNFSSICLLSIQRFLWIYISWLSSMRIEDI